MIRTEEDDEFERIAHEIEMKKGQPYYFKDHTTDPDKLVYRKPSRIDDDDIQEYVRPWVGLTEEEVFAVSNTMPHGDRFDFAEAIEAKLKEKNT
jgi:hypothetical protein